METLVEYINPDFESQRKDKYKLSVLCEAHQISYLISEYFSNKIIGMRSYALPNKEWQSDEFLKGNYAKSSVAFVNRRYTVLPMGVINQFNYKDALSMLHPVLPEDVIYAQDIVPHQATIVQAVSPEVYRFFSHARMYAAPAPILENLMRFNLQPGYAYIFVSIYKEYIEITVLKDRQLRYLNTFVYETSTDVLYFLLFVMQQLGLKAEEEEVFILRNTMEDESVYENLRKYCKKITIIPFPKNIVIDKGLNNVPYQNYYNLLSLSLCE